MPDAMADDASQAAAKRVRQALEMHDAGVAMYRMRMRRGHPTWSEAEVSAAVRTWLRSSPLEPGRPASPERWRRLTVESNEEAEALCT